MTGEFNGFGMETVRFFRNLERNNNRQWFADHKVQYNAHVLDPAKGFVFELGKRLLRIAPKIYAEPRIDRSIFRIYRDTRFSGNKNPYKTHLGIFLWEGPGKKVDCSGFYFHLEPPNLMLGVGIYIFDKPLLEEYRKSAAHPKHGPALARAVSQVEKKGYGIGGSHYKRVPRGFDPKHKNAELLRHKGLYAGVETKIPREFYSADIVDYCYKIYRDMLPLHRWLLAMTERATG